MKERAMTSKQDARVVQAMKELRLAPETVADAIVCPSGEVVLVLNSSRIVSWTPDGTTWPVRPSSAGPLGDGGRVGPPRCEEARLLESRRWRVRVVRAGTTTKQGYVWTSHAAEQVADQLVGVPVAA
jgi:hypothetical protein